METLAEKNQDSFVDRRSVESNRAGGPERRQFRSTPTTDRPEVQEFSQAVDQYKLARHRRFITYEELLDVLLDLGYHR